uniref:Uncharacterized protein n=1 Tax=viral metagenome TaxID=1070528 RepID=A0A6C0KG03_9ZZZZ
MKRELKQMNGGTITLIITAVFGLSLTMMLFLR